MRPAPRRIAVLGLGRTGEAVVRWALSRRDAGEDVAVSAFAEQETEALAASAEELRDAGAHVSLGVRELPPERFDIVVASPGIAPHRPIMRSAAALGVPLDLGARTRVPDVGDAVRRGHGDEREDDDDGTRRAPARPLRHRGARGGQHRIARDLGGGLGGPGGRARGRVLLVSSWP